MKNNSVEKGKQRRIMSLLANKRGDMFYEIIIKTIIIVVFLLTLISFYQVFIQYQQANYLCRRVVRAVEVEGAVSSEVYNTFNALKVELNLPDATMDISDVHYFDAGSRKIQLRDNFTVTIRSNYQFTIMNPTFAPPLVIPLNLKSTLTGMSEVYWKR